jgi:hypothetical protein
VKSISEIARSANSQSVPDWWLVAVLLGLRVGVAAVRVHRCRKGHRRSWASVSLVVGATSGVGHRSCDLGGGPSSGSLLTSSVRSSTELWAGRGGSPPLPFDIR